MIRCLIAFSGCGVLCISNCSPDSVSGGTSTSENGRVAGRIVTSDGVAALRTQVMLLSAGFDPVSENAMIHADTTDTSGNYSFALVAPGEYSVQSVHIDDRTRALTFGIQVEGDTVLLSDDTLRASGSIRIALPDSLHLSSGYIYIPGTVISMPLSDGETFAVLDSVPAGMISSIAYASSDIGRRSVLCTSIEVRPVDTVTILNTGWRYSRQLRLNTSPSGAAIDQTLYRFPVLIRLTGNNFPFDQARPDGSDLLFTKKDNIALPCEIERWDAAGRAAEVWVGVDTLPGNDSTYHLTMHWGNRRATAKIADGTVFDTATGFAGVWHFGESGDTLYDATTNRYNGGRHGSVAPAAGMIGSGQRFDTSAAYCEMGNVLNTGDTNFTVSVWIKRDTTGLQAILSKSNGGSPSSTYGWLLTFGEENQLECFIATGGTTWGTTGSFGVYSQAETAVTDTTTWHFVAAVIDRRNNTASRMYLDGEDVTGEPDGEIGTVGSLANTLPLLVGAEADGDYQWTGSIDECVISFTARSEAWVRLCYANQGPVDRLVEFR